MIVKKIISLVLTLTILCVATSCVKSNVNVTSDGVKTEATSDETGFSAGISFDTKVESNVSISTSDFETIKFGKQNGKDIEWLVLSEEEDGSNFLLSKDVLLAAPYEASEEPVQYIESSLCDFLNSSFIEDVFSDEERIKMIYINGEERDSEVGDAFVTLIGINTLKDLYGDLYYESENFYGSKEYFHPNKDIVAKPTTGAIDTKVNVFDNEKFAFDSETVTDTRYDFATGNSPYWLFDNTDDRLSAAFVTATGYINYASHNAEDMGVRPLIRIRND